MLRIATRRSALAQAQARQTGELLANALDTSFELVPMATTGDRAPQREVTAFDTKGLFVDALREAVRDGACDLAVHSFKDLPSEPFAGVTVAAVPAREDPRDLLVTRDGRTLASLEPTAVVGTSSERRSLQLLRARPSLQVLPVRGNLDTRLRKVVDGEFDAVVVALAGLRRLYAPEEAGGIGPPGLPLGAVPLEPGECLPAAAQGALAVEVAESNTALAEACRAIDDAATRTAITAERAFLAGLDGGCLAPVGALARAVDGGQLELIGMLADPIRRQVLRLSLRAPAHRAAALGSELAADVRGAGGEQMLASIEQRREQAQ